MTAKERLLNEGYENIVVFDNPSYDDALIGVTTDDRAVYDYDKMVEWLSKEDGISYESASDWISYNTLRAMPYEEDAPIVIFRLEGTQ